MSHQGNSTGSPMAEKVTPASEGAAPTPTPWDYVPSTEHHGPYITSSVGGTIADLYLMSHPSEPSTASGGRSKPISFYHEMADPNAELIVRAVNAHDDLIEHLRTSTTMLEALLTQLHSWGHESAVNASGQIWKNEELLSSIEGAAS